ncbi:PrgI family protein [Arthrobacter sp. B0490]|uniref:PrgI family protein n=1 Tax=Arthrobacter sp. B0490 TaxID=2058891 RepID=UPI0011B01C31|nr:PrgI family protein [Arthrobacter sp. B0490]
MTEASEGQRATGVASAGSRPASTSDDAASAGGTTSAAAASHGGTPGSGKAVAGTSVTGTSASGPSDSGTTAPDVAAGPSKAVVGPFTLRELVFGGGVALIFIGTLLPFIGGRVLYTNFWSSASLFFIGIGILLPVVALALVAARRLGSSGLRVGSLSVDQFASVTAVLAATFFFLQTVTAYHVGPLVALIGSLGMLAATVAGPFLPVLKDDFADRPEVPALTAARPITAARPRPPKPAKPAAELEAGPVPSSSRTDSPSPAGVNPAAAGVRQNGAGLYGAGGAGAVGAGAAAAGQSGMERSSSTPSSTGAAARDAGQVGAHAVGSSYADADTEGLEDRSGRPDEARVGETRVHEVVTDGTRTFAAADSSGTSSSTSSGGSSSTSSGEERGRQEPITATRSADEEPVVEAFWFAVGSQRPVYDEQNGREVFKLQPGDWEVGIEDRGNEFLVQDKRTGAVGILRDLRNIERAPRD